MWAPPSKAQQGLSAPPYKCPSASALSENNTRIFLKGVSPSLPVLRTRAGVLSSLVCSASPTSACAHHTSSLTTHGFVPAVLDPQGCGRTYRSLTAPCNPLNRGQWAYNLQQFRNSIHHVTRGPEGCCTHIISCKASVGRRKRFLGNFIYLLSSRPCRTCTIAPADKPHGLDSGVC